MPALTGPGPFTPAALLTELLPALEYIHGLRLVHRDLKPENIFLRSHEPFDLVLGDFGLVRLVDGSVRFTRGGGTAPYMPPEAVSALDSEASPAWDWWSVGMICAELSGGRHPFATAGGKMASDEQIYASLAQRPVDLSAVTDERDLLLCHGLLVADRKRRWGAEQVRAWLAGESPALPASAAAAPAGARTVLFRDIVYTDAASLAAALQGSWNEAMEKLYQNRDGVLVAELEALLLQERNDDALAALTDQVLPAEVGIRFARLLLEMNAGLAPKVGPVTVSPQGLEEAALNVVQHPGESVSLASALRSLRSCHVLRCWRELDGMERGPQIEREWLELIHAYEQTVGPPVPVTAKPDPELAAAWLLLVALDPGRRVAELRDRVEQGTTTPAGETEWWATLAARDDNPAALVASLLTQGAAEASRRQVLEERQREQEESRRAEEERARQAQVDTQQAEEVRARRADEAARQAQEDAQRAEEARREAIVDARRAEEARREAAVLAAQARRRAHVANVAVALSMVLLYIGVPVTITFGLAAFGMLVMGHIDYLFGQESAMGIGLVVGLVCLAGAGVASRYRGD